MKGNEMSSACSMHRGNKKFIQNVGQKTPMEETWEYMEG
jgi:hypothetical protein